MKTLLTSGCTNQRGAGQAIRHHGEPEVVTIDKSGANTAALVTLNAGKPDEETITVRQSKYLNNLVEQDYRKIKRRIRPMLGFKSFRRTQTIPTGVELIHIICKGNFITQPAMDCRRQHNFMCWQPEKKQRHFC